MGLNLGTLVTILVVLILFIVLDGVRRVLKEKRGSLSLRIDKRFVDLPDSPDHNPELPAGGARLAREKAGNFNNQPAAPLVMEPTIVPASRRPQVQVDMFGAEEEKPEPKITLQDEPEPQAEPAAVAIAPRPKTEPNPEPETHAEVAEPTSSVAPSPVPEVVAVQSAPAPRAVQERRHEPQLLEVIVAYLLVPAERPMAGRDLLQALLEQGLRYGDMNIFHRHQGNGKNTDLLFSVANALEPGTFDLDEMESQQFRAVTFFMKFPGPSRPLEAFEIMQRTLLQLASQFDADLRDEHRNPLTPQALSHLREQVQELERRALLAEARQE